MSKINKIALGLLALILAASLTYAVGQPDKIADIRQLIHMTGEGELGVQIMQQMITQYKQTMPDVPARFWDRFMQEVNPNDLTELVVPIYDRHFTHDDIKGLLKFYQTPLGQKLIAKLPAISQEAFAAGQQWGQALGEKVIQKLRAEGYRTQR